MPLDIDRFFTGTATTPISRYHDAIRTALQVHTREHGRSKEWDDALMRLNKVPPSEFAFDADTVQIGEPPACDNMAAVLEGVLETFMPWRKGPFNILGMFVDTEWRSDWKWQRLAPYIAPLTDKLVLDVGCGNGYHLFRMLGAGARLAVGADPTMIFNYQFQLCQQLVTGNHAYLLPLRCEHLPGFNCFDSVFSLGVLYHRRSPIDHLSELMSFLKPKGELILETLVIEGNDRAVLVPEDRYAQMSNVWFIPSVSLLENMLRRVGFTDVQTVDVTVTTCDEQRATRWMDFQSLADFLDPADLTRTVEGYPAPRRAILIARKS